jgi:hypothetical protein
MNAILCLVSYLVILLLACVWNYGAHMNWRQR